MTTITRRAWLGIGAAVTVTAAVAASVIWAASLPDAAAEPASDPPHTQAVISGPLTSSIRTSGRIVFENTRDLTSTVPGVLTTIPAPSTVVGPGSELYRVNDVPVILLRGSMPAWREFTAGMSDGPDVQQLEQNLADLGFFEGTVDEQFTDRTAWAIRAWQKALGLEQKGSVELGLIVFSPSDIRVSDPKVTVGTEVAPGTALYSASGSAPKITAEVAATERDLVPAGTPVSIALPSGGQTTGTVEVVGGAYEKESDTGGTRLVVPVTVTPDDPASLADLVPLTAQLTFTHETEEDVLQVPVAALIAVGDDEFGVEVADGDRVRTVAVTTGRFSGGNVEIAGGDLEAGDEVVVPE